MAKAPEPQNEANEKETTKPPKGKLPMILLIVGIMGLEGVGVFALANFLSPAPPEASAAGSGEDQEGGSAPLEGTIEIKLADCRVSNRQGAKVSVVSIKVSGLFRTELGDKVKLCVEEMRSRIDDRVSFVLRGASQQTLSEPGLQSLKRQLNHEFDRLLGEDGLLLEVLIPEFYQTVE
jgi:flagellar basal body-associated protein FliL